MRSTTSLMRSMKVVRLRLFSSSVLSRDFSTARQLMSFSSMALKQDDDDNEEESCSSFEGVHHKHCKTCTCDDTSDSIDTPSVLKPPLVVPPCGTQVIEPEPLPPPLPEPKFTFRRRLLPDNLIALNSKNGRHYLTQALVNNTAASYIPLTEQFLNQSDPAFCGVTTLLMVLNALAMDPGIRWRGGWRYFGSEDVLLATCCLTPERIRRIGISMSEFERMASCQGLRVSRKQSNQATLDDFRQDVMEILSHPDDGTDNGVVVVSFSRMALGQTGEGHFSPIAAYHAETDQVLVLDVARFKYQPYWVKLSDMYQAMCPIDEVTQQPRGWYVLRPPVRSLTYKGMFIQDDGERPAQVVPQVGDGNPCPVHPIKIDYCKANEDAKKEESSK